MPMTHYDCPNAVTGCGIDEETFEAIPGRYVTVVKLCDDCRDAERDEILEHFENEPSLKYPHIGDAFNEHNCP